MASTCTSASSASAGHDPGVTAAFTDLFSTHAERYAASRPAYPEELYRWLASVSPGRAVAWDCGTGNGQAARDLARWFDRVIATDASAEQVALAPAVSNVEFRVAPAEASALPARSVDLVAVAQALHWFDLDRFYVEVRRVTVPGGLLAAWSYGACSAGPDVEATLRAFEHDEMGPWWHANRRFVDEGYRTIPFPFPELPAPTFQLRVRWNLRQLGMYLASWSAVAAYRRERGEDPVPRVLERIAHQWGAEDRVRDVTWPLTLRVGRIE